MYSPLESIQQHCLHLLDIGCVLNYCHQLFVLVLQVPQPLLVVELFMGFEYFVDVGGKRLLAFGYT